MLRHLIVTVLALGICLSCFPHNVDAAKDPRVLRRQQINNLIRLDQRSAALHECRVYVQENPRDATMQYNLACLENTEGEIQRAAAAFRAAITSGFAEFEAALTDPDLQGELHQTIDHIIGEERGKLAQLAREKGFHLTYLEWTEVQLLSAREQAPTTTIFPDDDPRLRLQWQDKGLAFELNATTFWEPAVEPNNSPPWQGGPGLMITLGVPEGPEDWDLRNHFIFAFGLEHRSGAGAMFLTSQNSWQRVQELSPKIRVGENGDWLLAGIIPWQTIMPFYPVVDTPLGFNATLYLHTPEGLQSATLLLTNDTLIPQAKQRRMARLDFDIDSLGEDTFLGKLNTSLSSSATGALEVELVAISSEAGLGRLSLYFVDQGGRSVLPDGAIVGTISLKIGANKIARQADFSSLDTGGYVIQAELTFPSGKKANWSGTVLQLKEGWQATYEERISYVGRSEQGTARYLLAKILASLESHAARRSPGPILTAMFTLDNMLSDAQDSGTILPDRGVFAFVYPGPDGDDRICRMYLPAGRQHADAVNPILVLNPFSGKEGQLAARIGRNYEFGQQKSTLKAGNDDLFPIYLVPEMPITRAGQRIDYLAEADACRRWAQSFFGVHSLGLVGVDQRADAALSLATRLSKAPNGLLIFAGEGIEPWPMAQPAYIREKLGPAPANLPITWISFFHEVRRTGQGREILQALRDLNYDIADFQEVRGGLNLTQVADRIVIWAEGLR